MAGFRVFMMLIQIASASLLIGLSIPLIRRMIPPNGWYGFRVPRTLHDPVVWYEANTYSGKCFLGAGIAMLALDLALYLIPAFDGPTFATACAVVALGSIAVAAALSFRFLGRITKPADR
jgi:uncharacterized membrane protein